MFIYCYDWDDYQTICEEHISQPFMQMYTCGMLWVIQLGPKLLLKTLLFSEYSPTLQ